MPSMIHKNIREVKSITRSGMKPEYCMVSWGGGPAQQSMKKINHTAKYTIRPKLTHSVAYQRGFGLSAGMKESHHAAVLDSQQRSAAYQSV